MASEKNVSKSHTRYTIVNEENGICKAVVRRIFGEDCFLVHNAVCCRPLTYLPVKDGRIMLLSVRAYMYLLSCVHSSCNERPTNSSANPIIARLSLSVIGRFDGFLSRLPFFRKIAAVLDFQFPIHSFPFLSVFVKMISFGASISRTGSIRTTLF